MSDGVTGSAGEDGREAPQPLSVRLLGVGFRGARSVGKATGIDQALGAAAEEAMVAAIESEAVERALSRVLQGPVVEEAVNGALESEAVKRALVEALDSELVDEVWLRLLASDEVQKLVERIAEAPEVRAAIRAQSVGFVEDIGHTIGDGTERLDGIVERAIRGIFRRPQRTQPTERAGAVTRALAFGIDALVVNVAFSGIAALLALVGSIFIDDSTGRGIAVVAGAGAWALLAGAYLVGFWSLAGQTLGMRFLGIRLGTDDRGLSLRASLRRLAGLVIAAVPLGLGYIGVVFDERRRGWQDRLAGVDVLYEPREVAPWSRLEDRQPERPSEPETTKAPGSRGLRPQRVS